jgi:DNA-directed RNA polymerase specialized sigma24 family protein
MVQECPQAPIEPATSPSERDRRLRASFRNSGEVAVRLTDLILERIARRFGLCAEAARDVVQEVYCALLVRVEPPKRIEAWLKQVTRFQSWRWLRAEQRRASYERPLEDLDLPALAPCSPEENLMSALRLNSPRAGG